MTGRRSVPTSERRGGTGAGSAGAETGTVRIEGAEVFFRRTHGDGVPTVFVHGNPTHSQDWAPFLTVLDGPAVAFDLPGFGRSSKHRDSDYSMHGLACACEQVIDALGIERFNLVVHDWGAVGLIAASRRPERVERLVVINAVPMMPGYRWHWIGRIWRLPVAGELAMATTTRLAMKLLLRLARYRRRAMPPEFIEMAWSAFDRGTRRAILRLYRSADPDRLAAEAAALTRLSAPALVLWGTADPYISTAFAQEFARLLPNSELELADGAGHWPWIDRPELVDRVTRFVSPAQS